VIQSERYDTPEWTYGKAPEYSLRTDRRYPGGKLEISLSVKRGVIERCGIRGDFLGLTPIEGLERALEGVRCETGAVEAALTAVESGIPLWLGSVGKRELLDCMFA
jgi:lipoate-protein ligase A